MMSEELAPGVVLPMLLGHERDASSPTFPANGEVDWTLSGTTFRLRGTEFRIYLIRNQDIFDAHIDFYCAHCGHMANCSFSAQAHCGFCGRKGPLGTATFPLFHASMEAVSAVDFPTTWANHPAIRQAFEAVLRHQGVDDLAAAMDADKYSLICEAYVEQAFGIAKQVFGRRTEFFARWDASNFLTKDDAFRKALPTILKEREANV